LNYDELIKVAEVKMISNMPINQNYFEIWHSKRIEKIEGLYSPEYRDYRKNWANLPKKHMHSPAPLHVSFESTTACNLRCPMCSRTKRIEDGGIGRNGKILFSDFESMISHCGEIGVKAVKYHAGGTGEPLLLKDIADRVKIAKSNKILDTMINTNAVLLTEEAGKALIDAGLDKLIVSFDSPYKEEYETIRVGAKFEEVVHNIVGFCQLKDRMNVIFPVVRVQMIADMQQEQKKVSEMLEMWAPHADVIAVLTKVDYEFYSCAPGVEYFLELKTMGIDVGMVCSSLWQRLAVFVDGRIIPCCGDEIGFLSIGDTSRDSLYEAWNGRALQETREIHLRGRIFELEACRRCGLYENYLRENAASKGVSLPRVGRSASQTKAC
jgi:MoaA/NifB/PqqE/SkfB family radical SAM enzyme